MISSAWPQEIREVMVRVSRHLGGCTVSVRLAGTPSSSDVEVAPSASCADVNSAFWADYQRALRRSE